MISITLKSLIDILYSKMKDIILTKNERYNYIKLKQRLILSQYLFISEMLPPWLHIVTIIWISEILISDLACF
jgi:hypothetical protein